MKVSYPLALCVVFLSILNMYVALSVSAQESQIPEVRTYYSYPAGSSYYERGEYYFNDVGKIDGPYDRDRARYYYYKAVVEGDDHQRLWYQLGRLDFLDGNYSTAIARFNKQIELHGDTVPNVYYGLGLTYGFKASRTQDDQDWRTGAQHFTTFLDYFPDSPWARTDLAWIQFSLGEYAEMIPVLEIGLETHSDHPWLLNMYGLALLNTGQAAEAANVFRQSLSEVKKLTIEDWGRAYPGNHPGSWEYGLEQFTKAVEENLRLSNAQI